MATIKSTTHFAVIVTLVVSALAFAAAAQAGGNGAVVSQTGFCSFDNAGFTYHVEINDTRKQKIENKSGNIIITCHFTAADITLGAPSRFLEAGFVCTVSGVDTTDSYFHSNKNGTADLHCVVHH